MSSFPYPIPSAKACLPALCRWPGAGPSDCLPFLGDGGRTRDASAIDELSPYDRPIASPWLAIPAEKLPPPLSTSRLASALLSPVTCVAEALGRSHWQLSSSSSRALARAPVF